MSIEDAIARDLVAVLFVTFTFGGAVLFLIVATMSHSARPPNRNVTNRTATRSLAIASSMVMGSSR